MYPIVLTTTTRKNWGFAYFGKEINPAYERDITTEAS